MRISAGAGAKGHRWYDWALIELADNDPDQDEHAGVHALLVRRSRSGELAFYRVWAPAAVPIAELVRVAGRRWAIEENFQAGKGLTSAAGLDEHQVRRWTSWRRWTVLAMLAHAFLAVTAAAHRTASPPEDESILTCGEVRRLLAALIHAPARVAAHVLTWPRYRRASAARARRSHCTRQATAIT